MDKQKIKITIANETQSEVEIILRKLINELRLILDEYSIMSFKFCEDASKFDLRVFQDILDTIFDDPATLCTNEIHLPKGESIEWKIQEIDSEVNCLLCGKNNEVKACIRLLHWFNKLIKSEEINGILSENLGFNEEEEQSGLIEKEHRFFSIKENKNLKKIYIAHIKNKVTPEEIDKYKKLIQIKIIEIKEEKKSSDPKIEDRLSKSNEEEKSVKAKDVKQSKHTDKTICKQNKEGLVNESKNNNQSKMKINKSLLDSSDSDEKERNEKENIIRVKNSESIIKSKKTKRDSSAEYSASDSC